MISSEWRRFFLVHLPVAALIVTAAAEVPAYFLSGVTLHRHVVDDLAAAVIHDPTPYKVALVGDSVTHIVTSRFRVGDPGEVADLTTHAQAGLPSSFFLIKRYLESGHRPQHVVLAISRYVLVSPLPKNTFQRYVQTVFTLPFERDFLRHEYHDYGDYRWKPALFSLETRVAEPLFSLARHPRDEIPVASQSPLPNPELEQLSSESIPAQYQLRVDTPTEIRPEAATILTALCQLGRRYHFQLHVIWAPVQTDLWKVLETKGTLRRIDQQLTALAAANKVTISVVDASTEHSYPYFDHEYNHIRGVGWEQVYANQLTAYIHGFESESPGV